MQNCKEMTLSMFHFSTKAEQIETQYGGRGLARDREEERKTNR